MAHFLQQQTEKIVGLVCEVIYEHETQPRTKLHCEFFFLW